MKDLAPTFSTLTLQTVFIAANLRGKATQYATSLILSILSNGPMKFELSLYFLPNRMIPFEGDTFRTYNHPPSIVSVFFGCYITFLTALSNLQPIKNQVLSI